MGQPLKGHRGDDQRAGEPLPEQFNGVIPSSDRDEDAGSQAEVVKRGAVLADGDLGPGPGGEVVDHRSGQAGSREGFAFEQVDRVVHADWGAGVSSDVWLISSETSANDPS